MSKRVRGAKTAHWEIVLAAARGHTNARIAAVLGISVDTVRKLAAPVRCPRPGQADRPAWHSCRGGISAADRAAVVALACQLPAATGVPLAHWTGPELAAELTAQKLARPPVSAFSVLRILAEHPVRPWQYQSWVYPRDPDFEAKAKAILDLDQGFTETSRSALMTGSCPLTPSRRSMPAAACMPPCPPRPAGPSATSTSTGARAPSRCWPGWTCTPARCSPPRARPRDPAVHDLAGQVMARPEYKNAPRVFVIVDSRSDHRGQAAIDRLAKAHPNAIMIHTPVHASWLNQVPEVFFSVIQKKVVTPTTSPASGSSPQPCWPSPAGTTRPPGRSAGNSPQPTCMT